MKKIITLALTLALVLAMALPAAAVTSVNGSGWNWSAVQARINEFAAKHYQQTEPTEHTVTYDYNGGFRVRWDGNSIRWITAEEYTVTGTHTIPEETPRRFGYDFAGWQDPDGVIYQSGDKLTVTADITLTAVWEKH